MNKWTDRPASDHPDLFDLGIEFINQFISKRAGLLAKVLPPLFGFGIFLLYFYRNQFYPSFDLFQFSSLLLAAAAIGFIGIGILVVALVLPGASIFHLFLNTQAVKEEIRYALPYSLERRQKAVGKLILLAYILPFLISNLLSIGLLLWKPELFTPGFFLITAIVSLVFGLILQGSFELKSFSFFTYWWAGFIALMIVGLLSGLILTNAAPVIDGMGNPVFKWVTILLIPTASAFIAGVCAMSYFASNTHALHFSLFFGLGIAGFSGVLTTLPEKTVSKLGLGNYSAELLVFEPAFCDEVITTHTPASEDCTLAEAHIVWSLGEYWVIRPQAESSLQLQIPARFIKTMARSSK